MVALSGYIAIEIRIIFYARSHLRFWHAGSGQLESTKNRASRATRPPQDNYYSYAMMLLMKSQLGKNTDGEIQPKKFFHKRKINVLNI